MTQGRKPPKHSIPPGLSLHPPSPASRTDWAAGEGRPSLPGIFLADGDATGLVVRFPMFPERGEFSLAEPLDVFALPFMRGLVPEDLRACSLVTLLRWVSRARATGTLTLKPLNFRAPDAVVRVLLGRLYTDDTERDALLAAFVWPRGSFVFAPSPPALGRRVASACRAVLLDGVRAMLLPRAEDELTVMFDARLALRPSLRREMEPEVDVLGLPPAEEALVLGKLDGTRTGERIVARSPLGRRATLQLLAVLSAFEYLDWS